MPRKAAPASSVDALPEVASLRGNQAARRQGIVDEAFKLLVKNADGNVQIRDIADKAGVALGTAYRYFGSKERLLAEVYVQWFSRSRAEMEDVVRRGRTNTDRVRLLARAVFDVFLAEPQLPMLYRELQASDDPAVLEMLHDVEGRTRELFRDALEGVEPRDADSVALIVMSVVRAAVDRASMHGGPLEESHRGLAKAVKMVLEFRDPALEPATKTTRPRRVAG